MAFLLKKKVTLKVSTVLKLMQSFGRAKIGDTAENLLNVRKIIAIAPELFALHYTPSERITSAPKAQNADATDDMLAYDSGEMQYSLDICFKTFKGCGKIHSQKRKKKFLEKLAAARAAKKKLVPEKLPWQPGRPKGFSSEIVASAPQDARENQGGFVVESGNGSAADLQKEKEKSHQEVVEVLEASPFYKDQIVHRETHSSRQAVYGELQRPLYGLLKNRVEDMGVKKLYSHQVQGIDFLRAEDTAVPSPSKAVVIATSTSSGKSLVYNIPVVESILQAKETGEVVGDTSRRQNSPRALYMFPTKALAQDQLRSLKALCEGLPVLTATYDGDTGRHERGEIISNADIIITNPDMLHVSILPDHKRWGEFFQNLEYIVLDEAHTYFGAFGSHVGCVMRRLLRVCSYYRQVESTNLKSLKFVCASATIGNPLQLFHSLIPGVAAANVCLIDDKHDGSPFGKRTILLWNPPRIVRSKTSKDGKEVDEVELRRKSSIFETAILLAALIRLGVKTLAFARTRKLTELVLKYTLEELSNGYSGHRYKDEESQTDQVKRAEALMTAPQPHLSKVCGSIGSIPLKYA